ncbi:MAG: 50S ribosomal protein L4 [Nanoarchaeota archaeon]|nr:50S ribosomal protein L4 [Nanoarchaeota archaeon]
MELNILDRTGNQAGKRKLPARFNEEPRPDLIKRAVLAIQANRRQPYGAKPEAGKRSSAKLSRRRRNYRGSYGLGISRVPRKIMSRRGTRFNWVGAFASGTVGGKRAHPPKSQKILGLSINKKEMRKAANSALAMTLDKQLVSKRGHEAPEKYPFMITKDFEDISKSKEAMKALLAIGLKDELVRASQKKVRPGRGKARGRKYRKKVGPLIVVSKSCHLTRAARNIPGVGVESVKTLNAEMLAPGAEPGRLTFFTEAAIDEMEKPAAIAPKKTKKPVAKKKVKTDKPEPSTKINPSKPAPAKQEKPAAITKTVLKTAATSPALKTEGGAA